MDKKNHLPIYLSSSPKRGWIKIHFICNHSLWQNLVVQKPNHLYQENSRPSWNCVHIAKSYFEHLKAWTEVSTPGIHKTIWQPPPIGWLKFNFDAAIHHDKVTAATCCRTDSGDLLFACSKILPTGDSLWGGAQAALLAISSARDMGCKYVLFEGDACENHDPRVKWASKCDPTDNGPTL